MNGNEIRQKFLEYFEKHGHKIVHSSPVYPPNDPTILFTNAGMNQFKDVFLGNERRDYKRAVSSRRNVSARAASTTIWMKSEKPPDIIRFSRCSAIFRSAIISKKTAINFAWDFLVNELKLDVNRLWFTVFEGDEEVPADKEARDLWIKAGASPERILPFGKKDNFWQMAETGPCGPNSEINYYLGDEPENPEKNRAEFVNADDGDDRRWKFGISFLCSITASRTEKGGYQIRAFACAVG